MIQLVGYYMWQSAKVRGSSTIESRDVKRGLLDATRVFQDAVCAPAYRGLTDAQKEFVEAMTASYPSPADIAQIAETTGKSRSWANKYRASLIAANVVRPAYRGGLEFAIPHFGEFLLDRI